MALRELRTSFVEVAGREELPSLLEERLCGREIARISACDLRRAQGEHRNEEGSGRSPHQRSRPHQSVDYLRSARDVATSGQRDSKSLSGSTAGAGAAVGAGATLATGATLAAVVDGVAGGIPGFVPGFVKRWDAGAGAAAMGFEGAAGRSSAGGGGSAWSRAVGFDAAAVGAARLGPAFLSMRLSAINAVPATGKSDEEHDEDDRASPHPGPLPVTSHDPSRHVASARQGRPAHGLRDRQGSGGIVSRFCTRLTRSIRCASPLNGASASAS